ncbi:hypothetical protein RJ641_008830 [Dillenia turbinata]|uniref:MORF/ORRM1/DAG-like MORF domain-containing protein n=1 Tax=Dillenia turbinata TaxID=194707 RepID=A0AAN8VBN7_9MAGN
MIRRLSLAHLSLISTSLSKPNPRLFLSSSILLSQAHFDLRCLIPSSSSFIPSSLGGSSSGFLARNDSFLVWGIRGFSTRSMNDSSNRPPKDTILLDGCDFKHWLVVVNQPDPNLTRDEIIDTYIKTLAKVVGSEEEAMKRIYSVSTKHYFAFSCLVSEELSQKIKELPGVNWVLPDSYMNVKEKTYGGEPFIDGQAVPYDPKYHEVWVRNHNESLRRSNRRDKTRNDRPRNFDRRRDMANSDMLPPPPPPPSASVSNLGAKISTGLNQAVFQNEMQSPLVQNAAFLNRERPMPPQTPPQIHNQNLSSSTPQPMENQNYQGSDRQFENRDFQSPQRLQHQNLYDTAPPHMQHENFQSSSTPQRMQIQGGAPYQVGRDVLGGNMPPPPQNWSNLRRDMPPPVNNQCTPSRDMSPPIQKQDFQRVEVPTSAVPTPSFQNKDMLASVNNQNWGMPPSLQNQDFRCGDMPTSAMQNSGFQHRNMPQAMEKQHFQAMDAQPSGQNNRFYNRDIAPSAQSHLQYRDMPPAAQNCSFQYSEMPFPVQNRDFPYRNMPSPAQNRDFQHGNMPSPAQNHDFQYRDMQLPAQKCDFQYGNMPSPAQNRDFQYGDMRSPAQKRDFPYGNMPSPAQNQDFQFANMSPPPTQNPDFQFGKMSPHAMQNHDFHYGGGNARVGNGDMCPPLVENHDFRYGNYQPGNYQNGDANIGASPNNEHNREMSGYPSVGGYMQNQGHQGQELLGNMTNSNDRNGDNQRWGNFNSVDNGYSSTGDFQSRDTSNEEYGVVANRNF